MIRRKLEAWRYGQFRGMFTDWTARYNSDGLLVFTSPCGKAKLVLVSWDRRLKDCSTATLTLADGLDDRTRRQLYNAAIDERDRRNEMEHDQAKARSLQTLSKFVSKEAQCSDR